MVAVTESAARAESLSRAVLRKDRDTRSFDSLHDNEPKRARDSGRGGEVMWIALYTSAHGLVGFRCTVGDCTVGDCTRVVRTLRGVKAHCWRVHKIKEQMEIPYEETKAAEPQPVRHVRECPDCGQLDCIHDADYRDTFAE